MKKLFYVFAVAVLAACNNASEEKKTDEVTPVDTTAAPAQDTTAAPAADTTATVDTSAAK